MPSPYVDLDRPPLAAGGLRATLVSPGRLVTDLRVVAETGSTNADVRALAVAGAPEGTLVATDYQSAGRGRLLREWTSPPRSGLMFSLLLRPVEVPAQHWPWLPLLTGCAVVEALESAAGVRPRLKWPNDVLLDDRKVCGILLERVETPTGPAAVVGVGLNVSTTAAELPGSHATSLRLAGAATTDRGTLLVAVVRTLEALYAAWRAGGDVAADRPDDLHGGLRAAYRARCATVGRDVRVQLAPDRWLEGRAVDVDEGGRLVVRTTDGDHALGAGDVVHVR
ncbi:BirA family transcriptional regulator, biotin operon repressor / biotin-[acetyl-CoA-carboxylase] ligase [Actinopolymorpha cephalotaxi]|uniref:biotin--[biotin carboxyl-carrier protein] ligase n=1 Tax=Actinopolymorpha cephalotaxi TaxID=504797 RepID=A0A1I2KV13_9ACTN|nr:biotin--[acetyl-CoA-carboxylase] ligase [Actinopolymorpha cephalotaxi]NYH84581.1 BirA family biotin operon repressor/biotin-[acetyl-CoA-carboxylase] ligase [Actinopolymorpha cephalotaxi]SFF68891.1 BirA family transcriptional regulator, biotin operon repressor / biotin-[acetyl-CoA-carboxylase] ligase [Actinopolymorpha cephalotaxi]